MRHQRHGKGGARQLLGHDVYLSGDLFIDPLQNPRIGDLHKTSWLTVESEWRGGSARWTRGKERKDPSRDGSLEHNDGHTGEQDGGRPDRAGKHGPHARACGKRVTSLGHVAGHRQGHAANGSHPATTHARPPGGAVTGHTRNGRRKQR